MLAAIAFNLTRAAGAIASVFHAKTTTATIRRQLIAVPRRLARSAKRLVIHLPKDWPWQDSWEGPFTRSAGHQPQQQPDHRAPTGTTKTPVEKPDRPAASPCPPAHTSSEPSATTCVYFRGGSRLSDLPVPAQPTTGEQARNRHPRWCFGRQTASWRRCARCRATPTRRSSTSQTQPARPKRLWPAVHSSRPGRLHQTSDGSRL